MVFLYQFFDRLLRWLGLDLFPSPFSDRARAGILPPDFDARLHRYLAIIRASLIGVVRDCLFVDVSRWQGPINWAKLKSAGAKGAIIKCGQGLGLDPRFVENWKAALAAGLLRGCYWYYDSRIDPKVQARIWADAIAKYGMGELPCFLDYEENYGGDFRGVLHFTTFLLEFQRLTKLRDDQIGIYTGYFYWTSKGINDSFWAKYWLWIAWYGNENDVILPKPWTQEKLFGWQYTDSGDGTAFGVSSKEIDLNFFPKGLRVFEALFGEVPDVPTPPQTGEEGMFRVVSSTYKMSLRKTPSINGDFIESFPSNTVFLCDRVDVPPSSGGVPSDKWAHVVSVNGVAKDAWVAQVHNGVRYCVSTPVPDGGKIPTVSITFTDDQGQVWEAKDVPLTKR